MAQSYFNDFNSGNRNFPKHFQNQTHETNEETCEKRLDPAVPRMGGMEMEGEMEAKPPGAQGVPVPVIRKKGTTLDTTGEAPRGETGRFVRRRR